MLKKIVLILCFSMLIVHNALALLPKFSKTVIFGDSLTDVGNYSTTSNNCIYFNAPITNHTENGNTTWANAGSLSGILASNEGGSNYAVAGYTSAQILTSIKSYANTTAVDSEALYIIWAGTNDVLSATGQPDDTVAQALIDGTSNVILGMETLYKKGARNFLIIELMDLSKTPMATYPHETKTLLLGLFPKKEDAAKLQNICLKWNASYKQPLGLFIKKHPDSHVYLWNPIPILEKIMKNPQKYGYPNLLVFNVKDSMIPDATHAPSQVTYCGNTATKADLNSSHYIFYNFIHPTPYTYKLMEQDMVKNAIKIRRAAIPSSHYAGEGITAHSLLSHYSTTQQCVYTRRTGSLI